MTVRICTLILLGICTATDLKNKAVYTGILLPFLIAGTLYHLTGSGRTAADLFGGILVGCGVLLIGKLTGGGIGTGDGLLLMVTGCLLGTFENVRLLTGGFFLSSLFSAAVLITGKGNRKTELPFVPFLMGSFLIMVHGRI